MTTGPSGENKNLSKQKALLEYEINKIELWLLHSIAYLLNNDQKFLSSQDGLLLFIPAGIFLKKCKQTLNIERHKNDFVHIITDDLIENSLPLVKKLITQEEFDESNKGMMARSKSFLRLFNLEKQIMLKVSKRLYNFKENLITNMTLISDLRKLSNYIREKYLSKQSFKIVYLNLIDSIKYRERLDNYLFNKAKTEVDSLNQSAKENYESLKKEALNFLEKLEKEDDFTDSEIRELLSSPKDRQVRDAILIRRMSKKLEYKLDDKSNPKSMLTLLQEIQFESEDEDKDYDEKTIMKP